MDSREAGVFAVATKASSILMASNFILRISIKCRMQFKFQFGFENKLFCFLSKHIPSCDIKSFNSFINKTDLSFECVKIPTFENTLIPSSFSRFMLEYGNGTLSI